jgi:hypothetical protein
MEDVMYKMTSTDDTAGCEESKPHCNFDHDSSTNDTASKGLHMP